MSNIVIILLAFLFFIFLIMLSSIWFINFIMKKYIGNKHLLLEQITQSKQVPDLWSGKFQSKIKKSKINGVSSEEIEQLQQKAEKTYLKKLNQLIQYTKKTRLVQDEETRSILLEELEGARKLWEGNRKNEFYT